MKVITGFLLILSLAVSGCVPAQVGESPLAGTSETPADAANPLAGTHWRLVSFGPAGDETPVAAESTVTLEFDVDGQAGGSGGCNSYGGPYTVQGDDLSFGEIVSTLQACVDQAVTEQEQQYLQALRTAGRFEMGDDALTVWYDGGVLNFTRSSAAAPTSSTTAAPTQASTVTPAPTNTPVSASTSPPPQEGGLPVDEATRINFAPGETGAEIDGEIAERASDYYVLHAQEGQTLSVEITSPNSDVLLTVVGEDGTPYKRYQNGPPTWTQELPATQDYFIYAVSVGPETPYTLRVHVDPLESQDPEQGSAQDPERVQFEPGAASAQRTGSLPAGEVKEYVLDATAGQTMMVRTVGYGAPVQFTVRGPGGSSWSGESQGSEVYIFMAQVLLPRSGDHVVTLSTPPDAAATRYDVSFTVEDIAPPTPAPAATPERIEFAPDATSTQRSGLLPTGPGPLTYELGAAAGQTLDVEMTSDGAGLNLVIQSPAGTRWFAEATTTDSGYRTTQTVTLSETGDYHVTLIKPDHTPSTNFEITFTIQ